MAAGHTQHPHPLALVVEEEPQTQEQDNAEDDQALQLEQSPTQDDRLEATELARLRSNYSRVSRRSGSTIAVMKPATFLGLLTYNIKKFWKNQVSVSVDHEACRDHLGMFSSIFFMSLYLLDTFNLFDWALEVFFRASLFLKYAQCYMVPLHCFPRNFIYKVR